MNELNKIKEEILPKSRIFFGAIEEQLNYYEKYFSKHNSFRKITIISLALMIFSVVPVTAFIIDINGSVSINIFNIELALNNFFIRWLLFSIITAIIYLILRPIDRKYKKKDRKYSINSKQINFAYLHKSIKALEVFLINGHNEYAITSIDYLRKYFGTSFIRPNLEIDDVVDSYYLPELFKELEKESNWLQLNESSAKVINAFDKFESKVLRRIHEKVEIDLCINILNTLLCYEYLHLEKVSNEEINSINGDLKVASIYLLEKAAEELLALKDREIKQPKKKDTLDKVENKISVIGGIFTHNSLVVVFLSWFFLIFFITTGIIFFGLKVLNLNIDSNIFIGAVSVILIVSASITVAIYSKRK